MNHHNHTTQEGFTLPEVIVAIAVLVLVIFSATNLVVSIIRTNSDNIHTITAYGLAQEGLEAVRNIRDSNWLLGARFQGELGAIPQEVWGASFPTGGGEIRYYTVNPGVFQRSSIPIQNVNELKGNTPWKLDEISDPEDESTALQTFADENSGQVLYKHGGIAGTGESTVYNRYVMVENISEDTDVSAFRVSSVVAWTQGSREREVRLVTELTDWNQGQL